MILLSKQVWRSQKGSLILSPNALKVLRRRFLLKGSTGKIIETPEEMFMRVARCIAKVDSIYDKRSDIEKIEQAFYHVMISRYFLPNSPTLMSADLERGQLSACFVLPIKDSMKSILNALKLMVEIQQTGGGTGFSFSRLRPRGDIVRSTMGISSGPVSFMEIFDKATDVVKQGGRRRGANMGILNANHPDIVEFITSKQEGNHLSNFNISVAATDEFMEAVEENAKYNLVNPRSKKIVRELQARDIFDLIAGMAWKTGDPGMVFIDEINRHNPTPDIGTIESTNPCGEQPLLAHESCNLGSINLAKVVDSGAINWNRLKRITRLAVHFLDNVIDANTYVTKRIERITKANRKIGLGVMGFAEMLIQLNIAYDSEEALVIAEKVMKFISIQAKKESAKLAETRGVFPNFDRSVWKKIGCRLRNAAVTTIAPTGTISIIAGCSSSIEPLFAICFVRKVMNGTTLVELNPLWEKTAKKCGLYSEELMEKIISQGSIKNFTEIPENIRRIFVTAHDIEPEWHVRMQAAFQKYTDNAVSKTVNLPSNATIADVKRIFRLAYELKCKGITVYRYGSKEEQVLNIGPEFSGGCPDRECPY